MSTDKTEHSVNADVSDAAPTTATSGGDATAKVEATAKAEATAKRDAKIEQLERDIEGERQHSASLRSTVNELKFQAEILEKSYSKQLEDARLRAEAAEHMADEQRARVADLDSLREDAIQLLTDAKAEIDRLESERNQFRRQLASEDGWQIDDSEGVDDSDDGGTINALLNDAKWKQKKAPDGTESSSNESESRAVEEETEEEMISPDLVFTAKAADN